jgi:MarR family 2-MHQ and catechol resistance regulon transcriptional repressor
MGTHYRGEPREVRALDTYIKLMRCANSVQGRLERRLLGLGLTDSQFGVLEALFHLGPSAQHQLGRALFTSRANVTTVVDNLERRGLVRRERDSVDRRSVIVHLTPDGRALIEEIFPGQVQAIVEEFSALGADEQEALGRLCKQLGIRASPAADRGRVRETVSSPMSSATAERSAD